MKKIIFCNRFAFPDNSATSQILSDLAAYLSSQNKSVTIITSRYCYIKSRDPFPVSEVWQGVRIHRVWSTNFGRRTTFGRTADAMTFALFAAIRLYLSAGKNDIIIAKTDPPLISVPCAAISLVKGAILVNWLQDLYPDLAVALGMFSSTSLSMRGLTRLRNWSLQRARANVAICNSMANRLSRIGTKELSVFEIPNWVDDEEIRSVLHVDNAFRKQWMLDNKFVVGYSGNLGRAHEYSTMLDAAVLLNIYPNIRFLVIGGGRGREELQLKVNQQGLSEMFIFKPYQDERNLSLSLSAADAHWVSLQPNCEGMIFPSKLYGIAAAARPILAITSAQGTLGEIVHRFKCGFVIAPGDARDFSRKVVQLMQDEGLLRDFGVNARLMVDKEYSRANSLRKWLKLVDDIQEQGLAEFGINASS